MLYSGSFGLIGKHNRELPGKSSNHDLFQRYFEEFVIFIFFLLRQL